MCDLSPDPNAPFANFSSNVTEGYAPLTVHFNDISQRATSRIWDFNGDGQPDSNDINPVYAYASPGTYTVNLTVSNENGTASKTAAINVLTPGDSNGGSSSGSSRTGSANVISSKTVKDVEVNKTAENETDTETKSHNNNTAEETKCEVVEIEKQQTNDEKANLSKSTPGFEIIYGITGLLCMFLYNKNKKQ